MVFITLMSVIPLSNGEAINPYSIEYDDQYTYDYFNSILDNISNTMNNLVLNDESYLNQSKNIYNNVELTRNEILLYNSKGIYSPSIYFIDSFYNLSKNLVKLCELNSELSNNLEMNTSESLGNARINAMEINDTLLSIEYSLDEIDNISILKKGNETLRFNTSNIRDLIKIYRDKEHKNSVYYINTNITNLTNPIIHISNENPILFENVKIYGIGNKGSLELYVDDKTYYLYILNDTFSITYMFDNVGIYRIYAIQNNKVSNIIYTNVSKIPVNILVDSKFETYINNNIVFEGKVVDYYGDYINGTIYINGIPVELINGTFTIFEYSPVGCVKNISIAYLGDEIHSSSNKTVEIVFKKYPTVIMIDADKYNTTIGDTIQIHGNIYGLNETSEIYVFVNNCSYPIYTKDEFSINISPNSSGVYTVYALYNGSDIYSSSKSNTITINIEDEFNPYNYALIIILLASLIAVYLYKTKYKKEKTNISKKTTQKGDKSTENEIYNNNRDGAIENQYKLAKIPSEISKAYDVLFDTIIKKYGLSRDTTPRELLDYIKNKNPNIFNDLKFITDIHEKNSYGNIDIANNEKKKFFKIINRILREI
jgi:hypothetical protein